jgi:photosystem II stability/assembly factor-like uncharacterized protein
VPPPLARALHVSRPRTWLPAAAPITWNWQNPLPDGNPLFAISCPSTSTCFAGGQGGPVEATADGGANWASKQSVTGLNSMSCASATDCVAVGDSGAAWSTSDGWTNASLQTLNGGNFMSGVSCPSVSVCFAVGFGGGIFATGKRGNMGQADLGPDDQPVRDQLPVGDGLHRSR